MIKDYPTIKLLLEYTQNIDFRSKWEEFPKSLTKSLTEWTYNIHPPKPTINLYDELLSHQVEYTDKIKNSINRHFEHSIDTIEEDLYREKFNNIKETIETYKYALKKNKNILNENVEFTINKINKINEHSKKILISRTNNVNNKNLRQLFCKLEVTTSASIPKWKYIVSL